MSINGRVRTCSYESRSLRADFATQNWIRCEILERSGDVVFADHASR